METIETIEEKQAIENVKQRKVEVLRIAHTTVLENSRSLPVQERQITAQAVIDFADKLLGFVEA